MEWFTLKPKQYIIGVIQHNVSSDGYGTKGIQFNLMQLSDINKTEKRKNIH